MKTALIVSLLAGALAAPALAQNPTSAPASTPESKGMKHGKGEHHPHIHHAHKALENAAKQLEEAEHDFGGHRAKALELTKQAIQELDAALQYAKDHPEAK